ncbi:transporter substrate-binding domain-containing protein [Roseicyclus sp.]|uniref:transporter substrate-binding domain-containing protein n=1 Tax=Roseicyclus sp. TaxID=1914329 RepID=UPI003F6BA71C
MMGAVLEQGDTLATAIPGVLSVAINYGNPILAYRDAKGSPAGVSVDLARRIADELGLACQLMTFDAAKDATAAVGNGACDLGFFAADPARADKVAFTRPYLAIQGNYLVREHSTYLCNEDVDQSGVLIGVGRGSAYDLFLTRTIRKATLMRESTSPEVVDTFLRLGLDVAAGVRGQLEADAARIGGLRLIEPYFMLIEQALGIPKALEAKLINRLDHIISRSLADGFFAEALVRHGVEGAALMAAKSE